MRIKVDIQSNVLALDVAATGSSVALCHQGQVWYRDCEAMPAHSEALLELVQAVLTEAGLPLASISTLAFGRGPGAFTGLRMAAAVVQGLGLALGVPIVPVSSLQALAQAASDLYQAPYVIAALDARQQAIYWAAFMRDASGWMQPCTDEALTSPEAFQKALAELQGPNWAGAGIGCSAYDLGLPVLAVPPSQARTIVRMVSELNLPAVPPAQALPVYIRNQVVNKVCTKS